MEGNFYWKQYCERLPFISGYYWVFLGIVEVFFQNGEGLIEQQVIHRVQRGLKLKRTLHKYQFSVKKFKLLYYCVFFREKC